ncbi:MAG: hypothetical protein DCC67_02385 [Planctomycetota bacterium]|nr:MAG: hypothetical protein DCC67_02385 [Planctomycetota bacterium]
MPLVRTYLALGDSMSIDDYTGIHGGGAVNQFYRMLGEGWRLDDRTQDGCRIPETPRDGHGELITLTIGGNDLLWNREYYLREGLESFAAAHLALLEQIRRRNPAALFIVGDIYHPARPLSPIEAAALAAANELIRRNVKLVGGRLARICDAFRGHEAACLCYEIEPTLMGATAIAKLFFELYDKAEERSPRDPESSWR